MTLGIFCNLMCVCVFRNRLKVDCPELISTYKSIAMLNPFFRVDSHNQASHDEYTIRQRRGYIYLYEFLGVIWIRLEASWFLPFKQKSRKGRAQGTLRLMDLADSIARMPFERAAASPRQWHQTCNQQLKAQRLRSTK